MVEAKLEHDVRDLLRAVLLDGHQVEHPSIRHDVLFKAPNGTNYFQSNHSDARSDTTGRLAGNKDGVLRVRDGTHLERGARVRSQRAKAPHGTN